MSGFELASWGFGALLVLIFLRVPIAAAMLITGIGGIWVKFGTPKMTLAQLKNLSFDTFSNYDLSVVPLFLLMGQFAAKAGLSDALFKAAGDWLGHRKGGTAMATVGACAGFGAVCGSSLATAATMGQVALPEMRRQGYSSSLATGVIAAGGTLGILIPPSVVLVIYAILTEQNIEKMFAAAFIPGLLAALGYMLTVAVYARMVPGSAPSGVRKSYGERFRSLAGVWPVALLFVAVIGGIYFGIFTPTEGAAVGAIGTGLYAAVTGQLGWRELKDSLLGTASATAMIYLILLGATIFGSFLAFTQTPQAIAAWVSALEVSPFVILGCVLLIYLVFGCVMDSLSMILLTIPIFFPIIEVLDFGLTPEETAIWFGILVLIVVEVGLITPPVGMNLFIIHALAKDVPMTHTYRGVAPFVVSDLIRVGILIGLPSITLTLVRWMG